MPGVSEALRLPPQTILKLHREYINPIMPWIVRFFGLNVRFVRAAGAYLTDDKGNVYLDYLSGFGALNLGHEPPEVLAAIREVEGLPNFLQSGANPLAATLAQYLAHLAPGQLSRSFFCSSGAEAVEAAIKLARAATGRKVLLSAEGAFHGKTMGALSVSGRQKYKTPFEPLIPETVQIPYDDLSALERRLKKRDVAAFIVEPIQGEAGVIVPQKGYLKEAESLCRKYGTLLLMDEIQTGMGRTGKLFCSEHEEVEPDVMILSKSLGGGAMPIGATVTTDAVWQKAYGSFEKFLLHTSTFGGNTRASAAAIAALRLLLTHDWIENAARMGEYLMKGLLSLQKKFSILTEVRGKGLMIGLSMARFKGKTPLMEGALTMFIVRQLILKHRILTAFTLNNYDVLRIAPPLFTTRQEADRFLEALGSVLKFAQGFERFRLTSKNAVGAGKA